MTLDNSKRSYNSDPSVLHGSIVNRNMGVSDAARALIERGWRVVPVAAGDKACRLRNWNKLALAIADVPKHFSEDSNIAVVLGPASAQLVDIDLDCTEALPLADVYLPLTRAEFGRPSKPRSHRLYIAPEAVFEAFADPLLHGKNTLLELRAQGRDGGAHQTLFPPSIADSERRAWHGDVVAPVLINTAVLRRRVAWLAIGCLTMRYLSQTAALNPKPDLPNLLWEADRALGRAAFEWLGHPTPDAPRRYPRPRRVLSAAELDLAELVHAIPNNFGWEQWNALGMAIYAVDSSDHGLTVFDDFSAKSANYDPQTVQERWRNYRRSPPNRTGIGKVVALALNGGWRPKEGAA
jgi:hypothetical protein